MAMSGASPTIENDGERGSQWKAMVEIGRRKRKQDQYLGGKFREEMGFECRAESNDR